MATLKNIQKFGNQLVAVFDDGSKVMALPTQGEVWVVSTSAATETPPWVPDPPTVAGWAWPFPLGEVTSEFRTPQRPNHMGMDFSGAQSGNIGHPIPAAGPGTVIVANKTQNYGGYGNAVVVDHGNAGPGGKRVYIVYAHMAAPGPVVNVGDVVNTGDTLGPIGNTGNSYGAHLHFEVRYTNNSTNDAVNPRDFMATKGL